MKSALGRDLQRIEQRVRHGIVVKLITKSGVVEVDTTVSADVAATVRSAVGGGIVFHGGERIRGGSFGENGIVESGARLSVTPGTPVIFHRRGSEPVEIDFDMSSSIEDVKVSTSPMYTVTTLHNVVCSCARHCSQ